MGPAVFRLRRPWRVTSRRSRSRCSSGLTAFSHSTTNPNLFAQALKGIDENINRYPEWISGDDNACALGPHATACVLRWTWRACEGQATRGLEFLQRIYGLEQECTRVGLDGEQCFKCFAALPEEFWPEIHARLSEDEYTEAREDTRSVWHGIHHHLERRFDPSAYLRSCEALLPNDWHYGEALIADAMERKDYSSSRALDATHVCQLFAVARRRAVASRELTASACRALPLWGSDLQRRAEAVGTVGDYCRERQSAGTRGRLPIAARR